ncbi:MAG: type II secretion system protein GspD [Phycisphaerales bacterium]|nr:MAG: type II secretion system protein GspD [Phycisphaerales bacterium]
MCCKRGSKRQLELGKYLFLLLFVMVVATPISFGGANQSQTSVEPGQSAEVASIDAPEGEPELSADGRMSFIAFEKDSSIKKGLHTLALYFKENIVPSSGVDGVLGFTRLRNVTFEEAMDAVLGADFKYDRVGPLIKVYTKEEYKKIKEDPDRKVHKVIVLYYITAVEAKNLVTPVLSADALVQTSSPAETDLSAGGGSGGSSGSSAGSGGGGSGDSLAGHETLVIYDFPEKIAKAEEVIASLDVRPQQVLVEATIMAVLLTEEMQVGVDLNFLTGVSFSSFPALTPGAGTHLETTGFAPSVATTGGLKIGIASGNAQAFISALESVTDSTVLANPKILALNKQEGYVLIGRNLGYRSSTTISEGGVATEGEVKFLETGTRLVFRPFIGNDGYIRMDIYPKDSIAELNDEGVPDETTTELKTNILVKDGETIVIGGLFRDVLTSGRSQVPILGNFPVVGSLFRGTRDVNQREEVIIILTVRIIEQPSETDGDGRVEDIRRKRFGAKDAQLSIGRSRWAEDAYAEAARYYVEGDITSAVRKVRVALILRPTYLEAIRLRERILAETNPDEASKLERIILEDIDLKQAPNWLRR